MLKAITVSLLMEQVLAPTFKFKTKKTEGDKPEPGTMKIRGFKEPSSKRVKDIVEQDLDDLKAVILQDPTMTKAMPGNVDPEVINKVLIPKIIKTKYPELSDKELEEVRQHVVVDSVFKNANEILEPSLGTELFGKVGRLLDNVSSLKTTKASQTVAVRILQLLRQEQQQNQSSESFSEEEQSAW